MASVDDAHVRRVAKDLISEGGLPLELVGVTHDAANWRVSLRELSTRHLVDIAIRDAVTPRELRAELRQQLDAACP